MYKYSHFKYKNKLEKMMNSLKFDFPKISELAFDIDYLYNFDDYLPSFLFNLIYKTPKNSEIGSFKIKEDEIICLQTCIEMKALKLFVILNLRNIPLR